MSFFSDNTNEIFGKIATLKTISEKTSKKHTTSSSANNLMDAIMEILSKLGGYNDIIKSIENILSKKLDDIEELIKSSIKASLKQTISCSLDPSIGDLLISTGVTFEIGKIDPMSILSIDPTSVNGSYAYFDNLSGINSKDFNVFIYTVLNNTINNSLYNGAVWYKINTKNNEGIKTPLFRATFNEYDEVTKKTNLLTIKADESLRGKKLSYFISEYLDSIKMFNNVQIISSIFDEIFGTKILSINKTKDQLTIEKEIGIIVDNIINNVEDENDTVDDSYYTFSNDVYDKLLENSEKRRNGLFTYNSNTNTNVSVNQDQILDSLDGLKVDDISISDQTKILTDTINTITSGLTANDDVKSSDEFSLKTDIVKSILEKLMNTISLIILSPKTMFLFSMTNKILGLNDESTSIDFIKKNINVYKLIILAIRDVIIKELISKIIELLTPMVEKVIKELAKETFSIYKKQLSNIRKLLGL
jgi:hypothetical protein